MQNLVVFGKITYSVLVVLIVMVAIISVYAADENRKNSFFLLGLPFIFRLYFFWFLLEKKDLFIYLFIVSPKHVN